MHLMATGEAPIVVPQPPTVLPPHTSSTKYGGATVRNRVLAGVAMKRWERSGAPSAHSPSPS
jgi:hypothetical protein